MIASDEQNRTAFYTKLFNILEIDIGVKGTALKWFSCFLLKELRV